MDGERTTKAPERSTPDPVGQTIDGRYRVTERIGRVGTRETVYKAVDTKMGDRVVVVKLASAYLPDDPEMVRWVRDGIRRLPAYDHPNIVKTHDSGMWEGLPYLVQQFPAGGTLNDRLDKTPREDAATVLSWMRPIARALDYLHEAHHLAHYHVDPSNILYDAHGTAFLAGFGTEEEATYAAPDATEGLHGPEYDQFSLAVIAYRALAGRLPHEGETTAELLFQKRNVAAEPLSKHCPALPSAACEAIMRALRREPTERHASCEDLVDAFAGPIEMAAKASDVEAKSQDTADPGTPTDSPGRAVDPVGQVVGGRYRVVERLGSGGMGTVYKAFDSKMSDRAVVLKMPHPHLISDPAMVRLFGNEIRQLATVDHPSIVKVHDTGVWAGLPFVVQQFLGGGSLKDRLERSPRQDSRTVLSWMRPVAKALDYIHKSAHIVHRDVKPSNILYDQHGALFLADFGIARAADVLERADVMPGSVKFMAPEAPDNLYGPSYDQYSLAVIVYLALSGQYPHQGGTAVELMAHKRGVAPKPLAEHCPLLPADTCDAVMTALEREPGRRHPSCYAFVKAFAKPFRSFPSATETRARTVQSTPAPESCTASPTSFSVFLSAKSEDMANATKVYEFLTSRGISVFFSPESLPQMGSADYFERIDDALEGASHLVVVTSTKEHVQSPWVKHEWSTFLNEVRSGRKHGNVVTVVFGTIGAADLPLSLRRFEVLAFGPGCLEKLLQYVRDRSAGR